MNGRAGADRMFGYGGNDTFIVDHAGDLVAETAGNGTDIVHAFVSYKLSNNVENLQLKGGLSINAVGNTLANTLIGNAMSNVLNGMAGADRMFGGGGNDIYVVDSVGDIVTEVAGEGTDLILSAISGTLRANVENLTLTGTLNNFGVGNDVSNIIVGNTGNNILIGYGGSDRLSGGEGADVLRGGAGADILAGGTGSDRFVFFSTGESGGLASLRDTILDFSRQELINDDLIDLSAIDANLLISGNQAFRLDNGGTFLAGEIRQIRSGADLIVQANLDGDVEAEFSLRLSNMAGTLTEFDFVF